MYSQNSKIIYSKTHLIDDHISQIKICSHYIPTKKYRKNARQTFFSWLVFNWSKNQRNTSIICPFD